MQLGCEPVEEENPALQGTSRTVTVKDVLALNDGIPRSRTVMRSTSLASCSLKKTRFTVISPRALMAKNPELDVSSKIKAEFAPSSASVALILKITEPEARPSKKDVEYEEEGIRGALSLTSTMVTVSDWPPTKQVEDTDRAVSCRLYVDWSSRSGDFASVTTPVAELTANTPASLPEAMENENVADTPGLKLITGASTTTAPTAEFSVTFLTTALPEFWKISADRVRQKRLHVTSKPL